MTSLEVREFKQAIVDYVQKSPLPDEVKRMVLVEVAREQEERTLLTLKKEIEERDMAEKGDDADAESV
jgi:hypothetical protein